MKHLHIKYVILLYTFKRSKMDKLMLVKSEFDGVIVYSRLKISIIAFFFISIISSQSSFGATYFAIANGNWNDNNTWSLSSGGAPVGAGIFPTSVDDVNFNIRSVTLTADAACKNLENSGGAGTLDLGNFNLSINGDITIYYPIPTFTSTGGYINLNGTNQTIQLNNANITIPYLELSNGTNVTQKDQGTLTISTNLKSQGAESTFTNGSYEWSNHGSFIVTGTITAPTITFTVTNQGIDNPAAFDFSASSSNPIIVGGINLTVNSTISFGTNNVTTSTAFVHTAGTLISGTVSLAVTLPIELTSFIIKNFENSRVISWETATETNNDFFTLERSIDGKTWEEIYTCKGVGTSTIQHHYTYTDLEKLNEIYIYYRLKQNDFNGDYSYSDIKTIGNTISIKSSISLYPNPYNGKSMNISGLTGKLAVTMIYDAMGNLISYFTSYIPANNTITLDIEKQLTQGTYIIKCILENQLYIEHLLVK